MRRKLMRHGLSSLTVSLPVKWLKEQNLKAGDELEINEDNNNLVIGREHKPEPKSIHVDVSGQGIMIHRIIAALYKAGYDEITVKYLEAKELEQVQNILERNIPEYDIIDYKQNQVKIRSISRLEPEQFETVFKRIFFTLKDIAADSFEAINNKRFDNLKNIIIRDKSLDKYSDFCRRFFNRHHDLEFKSPHNIYYLLEETEVVGDIYKELCQEVMNRKVEVSKDLLIFLKEINELLNVFVDTIFKFDLEKIKAIGIKREHLKKKAESLFNKVNKGEYKVFCILIKLSDTIFEMKSALLTAFV